MIKAGLDSWYCRIAAVRFVRRAEGSNGCKQFVPEAEETKKSPIERRNSFHGERIMASITLGRSLSVLRIWFMASLGRGSRLMIERNDYHTGLIQYRWE